MSIFNSNPTNFSFQPTNSNPLLSQDRIAKNGVNYDITTFHNCITALKEYENKSLEELRWEDYNLNRKYPEQLPPLRPFFIDSSSNTQIRLPARTTSTDGTRLIKYKPTLGADIRPYLNPAQQASYVHHDTVFNNICGMLEYEDLSQEELRFYDYKNGIKFKKISAAENIKKADQVAKSPEEDGNDLACCPICLESITALKKSGVKLNSSICGHVVCKVCLDEMVKKSRNLKLECPSCRKSLNRNEIHELFI